METVTVFRIRISPSISTPSSLSLSLYQSPFSSVFFLLFLFFSKIFSSSSSRIFSSILSCFNIRCNNNGILRNTKKKNRFINFMYIYIYICITGKRIAERCAINYDYCNEYFQSLYIIFRTSHKIYFIFEIFLLTEDRQ